MATTITKKIHLYPNSHAGYYPGARPIAMKVLFRKSDGKRLGAQALGEDNVDKRISALAMALQMGATIHDREAAEPCYAPQFGSAKDPVNFAGLVAADILGGDRPIGHWDGVDAELLLDVRKPVELAVESKPRAVDIPLGQLRARLDELPRDRAILVICRSGQRAHYATRLLLQHGFKVHTLSGGMLLRFHSYLLTNCATVGRFITTGLTSPPIIGGGRGRLLVGWAERRSPTLCWATRRGQKNLKTTEPISCRISAKGVPSRGRSASCSSNLSIWVSRRSTAVSVIERVFLCGAGPATRRHDPPADSRQRGRGQTGKYPGDLRIHRQNRQFPAGRDQCPGRGLPG
nr:rhodanese-like domain-containing protein [Candidatus Competibacter phosphatis]